MKSSFIIHHSNFIKMRYLQRCIIILAIGLFPFTGLPFIHPITTGSTSTQSDVPRSSSTPAGPKKLSDDYARIPMSFERNLGQADATVKYLSRGRGYQVFLTEDDVVLRLTRTEPATSLDQTVAESRAVSADKSSQSSDIRLRFEGSRKGSRIVTREPLPGRSNYFIGNDPDKWIADIPNYARIEYRGVYPGIDLAFYGTQKSLEYDFIVSPGADTSAISVGFEGVDEIEVGAGGDLVLKVGERTIYQRRPVVYQDINSERKSVPARYVRKGGKSIGFAIDGYDASRRLIIDPVLEYSTFLGGTGDDTGQAIAVDAIGNAYITGVTSSTDFLTSQSLQAVHGGGLDIFVTRLSADGSTIQFSTYLGGAGNDVGNGIALDVTGAIYLTGNTTSTDFITSNPLQDANRGASDAFVAKLNPAGTLLIYSTYLGSGGDDVGYGIAVDGTGNAYVTGYTTAGDFNTVSPLQPAYGGDFDAFVAKINAAGTALDYSTYLGGSSGDIALTIDVDTMGQAVVAGFTTSTDFNTQNPLQSTPRGGLEGFVSRIAANGSALVYSTYLGGSDDDRCNSVAIDSVGRVYVTGTTSSTDLTTVNPLQNQLKGISDLFIAVLNAQGNGYDNVTYLGGSGLESGRAIAVNPAGDIFLTGETNSTDYPLKNPLQGANSGGVEAFVTKIKAGGSELVYSTYLGGGKTDSAYALAIDGAGNAFVTGSTDSVDFNVSNAFLSNNLGGLDAFVSRISPDGSHLDYSTYLGGSGIDLGLSIAVDTIGNAYLTGFTAAADFPVRKPLQARNAGVGDAFVAKINSNGTSFVYVTYFGGSGIDQGLGIAVGQDGRAVVTGVTASIDFATSNPLQADNRGGADAFLAMFNELGGSLIYSTYLGGNGNDAGYGVALDGSGNIFMTGSTGSTDFSTSNPLQASRGGEDDAFVARIDSTGANLIYSTYLGGAGFDNGVGIAVDQAGSAYITGITNSTDFPTQGAIQANNAGELDTFVTKISPDGSSLGYSTYLGGAGTDFSNGIAVDVDGNAYVTGATGSTDFKLKDALQSQNNGSFDAFVTKIDNAGSALIYSTYLGGENNDFGLGIVVDAVGKCFISGSTSSTTFPLISAIQTTNHGNDDVFVSVLNEAGSALTFSTYLGGGGNEQADGIAIDAMGTIYLVGQSGSADFPLVNPLQPAASGNVEAFIAKIVNDGGAGGTTFAASVSAASYSDAELAAESIVAAFGLDLATTVEIASTVPLPTALGGTTVKVKDSAGDERLAPLFFVAPSQVNYQIPPGTATGPALVTITSADGKIAAGTTVISNVAPGLFSANADGLGIASAVALRVKSDGTQIYEPIAKFDAGASRFVSTPIDLGPEGEQVYLIMFGTGLRNNSSLQNVSVIIGGATCQLFYAGLSPDFVGLDQVNLLVPRSLIGSGEVDLVFTADGKPANMLKVNLK